MEKTGTKKENYELTKHRKRVHERAHKENKDDPPKPKGISIHCFMCTFSTVDRDKLNAHLRGIHNTEPFRK